MQTKEHVYNENLIIEYPDGTFLATYLANPDNDIQTKTTHSLEEAKAFIDGF